MTPGDSQRVSTERGARLSRIDARMQTAPGRWLDLDTVHAAHLTERARIAMHVPPEQNDPPKHPVLHAPQLRGSICVLVQVPLHWVVPVEHTGWQLPSTHT